MTTSTDNPTDSPTAGPTEAAAERVFGAILGAVDLLSMYLGDRLGHYRSLAGEGPASTTSRRSRVSWAPSVAMARRPVEVLAAVHRALAPGAPLVVMDEAVADAFAPDGDKLERLMCGFSLFVCLPDDLSSPPSVGTGTVMRPSTLAAYGQEAGFCACETLPIEDFGLWRFYRLEQPGPRRAGVALVRPGRMGPCSDSASPPPSPPPTRRSRDATPPRGRSASTSSSRRRS